MNTLPLESAGEYKKIYGNNAEYAFDAEKTKQYTGQFVPSYLGTTNINPFSIDITGKWLVGDGLKKNRLQGFVDAYVRDMTQNLHDDIFCHDLNSQKSGSQEKNNLEQYGYMGCNLYTSDPVQGSTVNCTNIIQCIQCTAQNISF